MTPNVLKTLGVSFCLGAYGMSAKILEPPGVALNGEMKAVGTEVGGQSTVSLGKTSVHSYQVDLFGLGQTG